MKHIKFCLSLLLAITLASCASKEDKANKLIKDYMYENLYDFESYEPMKTTIDTMYTDIRFDKEAYALALVAGDKLDKVNDYLAEVRSAQTSMDIWSDSGTSYGRSKYNEAKDKCRDNLNAARKCMREMYASMLLILDRNEALEQNEKGEAIGWKVGHRFRCKTKGGNSTIGEYIFVMDKDLKEVIATFDIDEEDYKAAVDFIEETLTKTKESVQKEIDDIKEDIE